MPEYRVDELAAEAGISVEVLRSYQSKGLVPPPRHEGRVAWYDDSHLERLEEILDLKHQGYSLRMIANLIDQPGPPADLDDAFGDAHEELLTRREVAQRSGVPTSMLRSLEGSGILRPRAYDDEKRYTHADVRAVRMLLALMASGLPLEEFLDAAKVQLEANEELSKAAVALFLRYGREPLLHGGEPDAAEAEQMVAALAVMLQATTTLIAYNFQRRVLNGIQAELQERGAAEELEVLLRESRRRKLEVLPA